VLSRGFGPSFAPSPPDLHCPLYFLFEQPVEIAQAASAFSIYPWLSGTWSTEGERLLAFTPLPGWKPQTTYWVSLRAFRGLPSFEFRVEPFVEASPPPEEAFGHALGGPVRFFFLYPPDRASVESALSIHPDLPVRILWQDRTLLLAPEDRWALDTTYTVELAPSAADASGWRPLTRPLRFSFTTRPAILECAPREQAAWDDPIWIQFDRPTDHASVEAALRISPPVTGTFSWQEEQLFFTPTAGLVEGASYLVRLEPSARAADGTPLMHRPLEWRFSVRTTSYFSFGYGPNIQVLDAAGRRKIQFQGSGRRVRFGLFRLPGDRFLSAYASAMKEEKPIDLEGLELLRQWEQPASGEVALPADLPPGLYVLTIGQTAPADALIVVLSHYALLLKEAGMEVGSEAAFQVRGAVRAIASGEAREGAWVRLYDRAGRLYGQARTDAQGLFEATVHSDTLPLLALAEVDGEITVCGFGPEWNPRAGWWEWWGWQPMPPAGRHYRAYLYTDRPIYRPGQTVYVRGIVRNDDDAVYSVPPSGTPVLLRLRDARGNVLATRELLTGEFGTVHDAFYLAEGGTQGTYQLELVLEDEVTRQPLKVEEYRKPELEVAVRTEEERYVRGEPISLTVSARYYFGLAASGASITLRLYRGYRYWEHEIGAEQTEWQTTGTVLQGTTDANGMWHVRLPAPEPYSEAEPFDLEATVDDGSGQTVSGHAVVWVHRSRYGTALFLQRSTYRLGEEIPVELWITDYQGNPVPGRLVAVELDTWDGTGYRLPVAEAHGVTDDRGRAHLVLRPGKPGWYRLTVRGEEESNAWLWVYEPGEAAWTETYGQEFRVEADRPSYAVGEVAHILVRSPVTGTALLTLERGRVRRMEPVLLTGPLTTLSLTIEPDFAPNLFVTVQIYRPVDPEEWNPWLSVPDATLLIGTAEVVVPPQDRRLEVKVVPERLEYRPGEEAMVTLEVRDAGGQPVRAELSLAVVDEAIYALSEELARDPFEAFYARRQNLVHTYHSLQPTRGFGGGEHGGNGDHYGQAHPRRDFPDTAYWNPSIVTDAEGQAVVRFHLPDSLTRWRLVARAVTSETQLGEGRATLTTTQPLVVRPALPRFLLQGDAFTATVALHNRSRELVTLEAGLQGQGLGLTPPFTYTIPLGPAGTARVSWRARVEALDRVTVTAYVQAPEGSDAVQTVLPVLPFAVPEVRSWAGEYVGEHQVRVPIPASWLPQGSSVEVRLSPSIVPTLLDGLEYLIAYPFG
jgi:uncharacterized protein YfaS (alpha-2-macroglobulin family)